MSSYDRRLLHQQIFGPERRDIIRPTILDDELPFVTRESVRQAMNRRDESSVWHTTGLHLNDIRPDYIFHSSPRSVRIEPDNEEVRDLREFMEYNTRNQRNQNRYIINDYMVDLPSSFSAELEKLAKKMSVGEFELEPKPSKKTLSNPRLSLKKGTDDE